MYMGAVGGKGFEAQPQLLAKKYNCFHAMQKPSKRVKTLINLCALPCPGLGLWLTLTVYFDLA